MQDPEEDRIKEKQAASLDLEVQEESKMKKISMSGDGESTRRMKRLKMVDDIKREEYKNKEWA